MGCNVSTPDIVPRPNAVADYQRRREATTGNSGGGFMRGRSMSMLDMALDIHERAKISAAAFVNSIPELEPHERRQLRSIAVNRAVERLSGSTGALTTVADPTNPQHFAVYEVVHRDPDDEQPAVGEQARRSLQQLQQQQHPPARDAERREQTFYFTRPINADLTAGLVDEEDGMTTGAAATATNSSSFAQEDYDDDYEEFNMIEVQQGLNEAQGSKAFDDTGALLQPVDKNPYIYSPTAKRGTCHGATHDVFALPVFGGDGLLPSSSGADSASGDSEGPSSPRPVGGHVTVVPCQPNLQAALLPRQTAPMCIATGVVAPQGSTCNTNIVAHLPIEKGEMMTQSFGSPKLISILKKQSKNFNASLTSFSVVLPSITEDVLSPTLTATTSATGNASSSAADHIPLPAPSPLVQVRVESQPISTTTTTTTRSLLPSTAPLSAFVLPVGDRQNSSVCGGMNHSVTTNENSMTSSRRCVSFLIESSIIKKEPQN
ncbi:Hypothetical protein, putative [Bodo saltans]|uniref:Uncharacterized protein n=1 Tax=Bodo saltans TaxID=75058 RepID=A0A0S4JRW6_BODSA|nr:Hypothetical protein, putative [Bodo saltans]|eukprot:CUG92952.1 Hypothetical protein, putative [Bodo saltans]